MWACWDAWPLAASAQASACCMCPSATAGRQCHASASEIACAHAWAGQGRPQVRHTAHRHIDGAVGYLQGRKGGENSDLLCSLFQLSDLPRHIYAILLSDFPHLHAGRCHALMCHNPLSPLAIWHPSTVPGLYASSDSSAWPSQQCGVDTKGRALPLTQQISGMQPLQSTR